MSLSNEQYEFAKDVQKLLRYLVVNDYKFTISEVFRTPEQQKIYFDSGKSKTMNSKHLDKKAIDLNIWVNGELTYNKDLLMPIGLYWQSLNKLNEWGGLWKFTDTPHFQRN